MRTRAATISLLATAALALGLGACGSGTSKATFVRTADKACAQAEAKGRGLVQSAPNVDPTGDMGKAQLEQVGAYLDRGLAIQDDLIRTLRKLHAPSGDRSKLAKIYATSDSGARQIRAAAAAAHAGDLAAFHTLYAQANQTLGHAQQASAAYGLKCIG